MYIGVHIKYPLLVSDFKQTWILPTFFFSKNTQVLNFMKIRPVRAELLHVDRREDGRTDRHDEAYSRVSQFCERT